jgi:hypothetical protein
MVKDDVPAGRTADHDDEPRWRITPTKIAVTLILITAIVVPLLTSTYARVEPRLFGFPFFYWYQFLWVFLAAGACWLSLVLLQRENRQHRARRHTTLTEPTGPPPGDPSAGESLEGKAE